MGVVCKESPSAVNAGAALGLRTPVDDGGGGDGGNGEGGGGDGGGAASMQRGDDAMERERDAGRSHARARFVTNADERSWREEVKVKDDEKDDEV